MTAGFQLAENRYGKSRVRLMKVTRHEHGNDLREWTVQVLLKGDFDSAHYAGDNTKILPTDTMKNTVYSVARNSSAVSIEAYAMELAEFLLARNPQVSGVEVKVESVLWKRLVVEGKPHRTPSCAVAMSCRRHWSNESRMHRRASPQGSRTW